MSTGEVIFKAGEMYDDDMWDDTELIRGYEKAYEASRELIRRRKCDRRKKNWNIGDHCRVFHLQDSAEYEGIIVKLSARSATVRLHGYNDEMEVPLADLEASQGQDAVNQQMNDAQKLQEEEEAEVEHPFTGELKEGAACRARWSIDDLVYEGNIIQIEKKKKKVRVRFIGYNNEDTVSTDEVFASKGEDWRDQQLEDAKYDFTDEDIDTDIHQLIDEHPDVFSQHVQDEPLLRDLSNLTMQTCDKPSRSEEKKSKSKSKKEKKEKCEAKKIKPGTAGLTLPQSSMPLPQPSMSLPQSSLPLQQSSMSLPQSSLPLQQSSMPLPQPSLTLPQFAMPLSKSSIPLPQSSMPPPQSSLPLPQYSMPIPQSSKPLPQSAMSLQESSLPLPQSMMSLNFPPSPREGSEVNGKNISPSSAAVGGHYSAHPQMMGPPPPPPLDPFLNSVDSEVLHSMLKSWYMAGYHTGYYQAHSRVPSQPNTQSLSLLTREKKKKRSKDK